MGFMGRVSDQPPPLVKVGFSFFDADSQALGKLTASLKRLGAPVRRGTVLRALAELTTPLEMFAAVVTFRRKEEAKPRVVEPDELRDRLTVDLPPRLIEKLDGVIKNLHAQGIVSTRTHLLRSILWTAPNPEVLLPSIQKFLVDYPRRSPRPSRKSP